MRIGYARVSTSDQNLDLQSVALKEAGCDRIFSDEGLSGMTTRRPGLDGALAALSSGDTLIVWKIDRLARSLAHLVQLIADLGARGIDFRSLSDPIDTGSAGGRLVLHMMGALRSSSVHSSPNAPRLELKRRAVAVRDSAGDLRSAPSRFLWRGA